MTDECQEALNRAYLRIAELEAEAAYDKCTVDFLKGQRSAVQSAGPDRDHLARLIWDQKPDCGGLGKPWPFDGKTPKEVRTIKHDMPAALELCFLYADICIKFFKSAPALETSHNIGERLPHSDVAEVRADTVAQASCDRGAQALRVVRQMVEAFDSGNLQMSSPEIGEPENDIPYHQWHDELLHYARLALEPATPSVPSAEREYDPNVAPCDDAEFGMKP